MAGSAGKGANRFQLYSEKSTGVGIRQPGRGYPVFSPWTKLDDAKAQCIDLMSTESDKFGTMRVVDTITGEIVYQYPR